MANEKIYSVTGYFNPVSLSAAAWFLVNGIIAIAGLRKNTTNHVAIRKVVR
ncbi:MAG: hypothetical protein VCB59_04215 [Gammaproteobacteria bacterium]